MNRQRARTRVRSIAVLSGVLLFPLFAHADIYKWVDANGHTHYGDALPKDNKVAAVAIQTKASPKPSANGAALSSQALQARQQQFTKQLERERLKREAAIAKEKRRKEKAEFVCLRDKNRLEHMKTIDIFYHENVDGTVRYLSDKEGDRLRKLAWDHYQDRCGDTANVVAAH